MRPREELLDRSPIAPGQAHLTLEFLRDGLLENKLQLVGTSILLILLSPEPGCYIGSRGYASKMDAFERELEEVERLGIEPKTAN